jgi:hypothetical protein
LIKTLAPHGVTVLYADGTSNAAPARVTTRARARGMTAGAMRTRECAETANIRMCGE